MDDKSFSHSITPHNLTTILSHPTLPLITTSLTLLLLPPLLALYIQKDYQAFLSLGPGGTPATPLGYLKIKLLSFICLRDPLSPIRIPPHYRPQRGYFTSTSLFPRKGSRPLVQGIAPQRQKTQKSDGPTYAALVREMKSLAAQPGNKLVERTSCFEKHSTGLFTRIPITRTCGGEICHAHPSDGSLHLTLHPSDAKMMLENGWGERHPLARGGWCRRFVPKEFVLVYAPRDEREVEVVMKIVHASIWWVSGFDVEGGEMGEKSRSRDVEVTGKAMEGKDCWACKAHQCGAGKVEKLTGEA